MSVKQTAVFTAEVSKPGLKAKWTKAGKVLKMTTTIDIKMDKTVHTLTIKNCQLDDAGQIAIEVDKKTSEANLTVTGSDFESLTYTIIADRFSK